jgi:predicted PurR-regulated permease PerM
LVFHDYAGAAMSNLSERAGLIGWLVFLGLVAMFIGLGMLRFLVFLLFVHLVVELLISGLAKRAPSSFRPLIFYAVFSLFAGIIIVLAFIVTPHFVADLPVYLQTLEGNLSAKINALLAAWNLPIQITELKLKAIEWGRGHMGETFDLAKRAGANVVLLILSFVLNFLIMHARIVQNAASERPARAENLWLFLAAFIEQKIAIFYGFFRQVMAAQVIISLINAILTLGLLLVLGIPHKLALTVLVFVFGLLPIVGNIISNTLICLSALLWSGPIQVVAALAFLVVIHKLEYFLNGKIIGNIVKLPMYLTLLALILGEALFHISGMILSIPLLLFVRSELSQIKLCAAGLPDDHKQ